MAAEADWWAVVMVRVAEREKVVVGEEAGAGAAMASVEVRTATMGEAALQCPDIRSKRQRWQRVRRYRRQWPLAGAEAATERQAATGASERASVGTAARLSAVQRLWLEEEETVVVH